MFSGKIEISAPCKINLHLNVKERRPDGYHRIESLFHLISFSDSISVAAVDGTESLRLICREMDLPADNTVSRAVNAFRKKTGIKTGLEVNLVKKVPAGAGLGGGSSDGAAVLCGLNRLFSAGLSADELKELSLEIGSDAPFFVDGRPSFVSGRGEFIRPLGAARRLPGILLWPGVHSGTAEAYAMLDESRAGNNAVEPQPTAEDVFDFLSLEYSFPPDKWRFYNSFTPVVSGRYPAVKKALEDLKSAGALFCEMSGSGSSVFGIFGCGKDSAKAFKILSEKWRMCYSFFLLDFSEMSPHN